MGRHWAARIIGYGASILYAAAFSVSLLSCTAARPPAPGSDGSEVITLAGPDGGLGSNDGTGAQARFNIPRGITTDGTNIYVADSYNHTIRKIGISTGVVTTLAGSAGASGSGDGTGTAARFYYPYGITTDGSSLYVADSYNHTIRKIGISTGVVTTLAGSAGNEGSDDGTGAAARFYSPSGITAYGANLYVADTGNHTIRRVSNSTGVVTTLGGKAVLWGSDDGTGAAARFCSPIGIATDGANLYVADSYNHTIRKIAISTGEVTTLAGTAGYEGSGDGIGGAARFYYPHGITTFGSSLYVADSYNHTVRRIATPSGAVTTIAGTAALFCFPYGITTDGANLYVADTSNHTIRKIAISTMVLTTIAGKAGIWGSSDGAGAAALFYYPRGIATDGANLYVADSSNHTIRKIAISTGEVTTLAGSAGASGSSDGVGTAARFYYPCGITTDGANLYVADTSNHTIRKIGISTGFVTTLAGTEEISGYRDGAGTLARFFFPYGITTDGADLYVADSSNHTIRKIAISTGVVTTFAGTADVPGNSNGTGQMARFCYPRGIETDGTNLYVADTGNHTIRRIAISTREVTTLAGSAGYEGSDDGTGDTARFYFPSGVTTDGAKIYVADTYNHKIRTITR